MSDELPKGTLDLYDISSIMTRRIPSFDWRVICVGSEEIRVSIAMHLQSMTNSKDWTHKSNLWIFLFKLFQCIQRKCQPVWTLLQWAWPWDENNAIQARDFADYYIYRSQEELYWDLSRLSFKELVKKTSKSR